MNYCKQCGNPINEGEKFCRNCGYKFEEIPVQVKKKPKRKHGFLKFLLVVAVLVTSFVITKKICNAIAEKDLEKIIVQYPFSFADDDSEGYVTQNFLYKSAFKNGSKVIDVDWTSSNSCVRLVQNDTAVVTRPEGKAVRVRLTMRIKRFLGEAEKEFGVTVIPNNSVANNTPISVSSVMDSTYPLQMEMCVKKDTGRIDYLFGEFEDTYVYTKEDAVKLANDYKEVFSIPDNIEFAFYSLDRTMDASVYTLAAYFGGYRLKNSFIFISVKDKDFSVYKISNGVSEDTDGISLENSGIDPQETLIQYVKDETGVEEVYVFEKDTFVFEKELCKSYYVFWEDNEYSATVSLKTGNVIRFSDARSYYILPDPGKGGYETVPIKTKDERGDSLEFNLVKYDEESSEDLDSEYYYVMDPERRIIAFERESHRITIVEKGNNQRYWDWDKFLKGVSFGLYDRDKNLLVESSDYYKTFTGNKTEDEAFVGAEAIKSIKEVYNYYSENFKRLSYDDKGTDIPVLIDLKYKRNAFWSSAEKIICIGAPLKVDNVTKDNEEISGKQLDYTWATDVMVLGHEYTHAVFGSVIKDEDDTDDKKRKRDMAALNEAYADIMGCIIAGKDEWLVGVNTCNGIPTVHRDLVNFNSDDRYIRDTFNACTQYYPKPEGYDEDPSKEEYDEYRENWLGVNDNDDEIIWLDEHSRSVPFSHVAYEIHKKGIISDDDLAKIYYMSFTDGGLKGDSTMIDARHAVLTAAEDIGCSRDVIEAFAREFDKVNITDEDFYFYYTSGTAIPGDVIYDDEEVHEYLVYAFPINLLFFGRGMTILEEGGKLTEDDQTKINAKLAELRDKLDDADGDYFDINRKIEYRRVSKLTMKLLKQWLPSDNKLESGINNGLNSISLRYFFFIWESTEETAYDFWKTME